MASVLKVDKLDPQSGTALEIGTSGDTVTVPTGAGLTVVDEVKTNKVSPATGTAFALGDSGDTFTVPSGATIVNSGTATGFGITAASFRPNSQSIIINGDMSVAQRTTSTAGITTSTGYYASDRFQWAVNHGATVTITQENVAAGDAFEDGFPFSEKIDVTTADASLGAAEYAILRTTLEGQNLQLFKKGTASAEKYTISFWAKHTKTGINIVELWDNTNSRNCHASYTIDTTNTWEKKVLNFAADTTGVIANTNAGGMIIGFWVAAGSDFTSGTLNTAWAANVNANRAVGQVNNLDDTANNFEITGVQLEVGEYTSATIPPFQHETFGTNLSRCHRYYWIQTDNYGSLGTFSYYSTARVEGGGINFPSTMRVAPTLDSSSGTSYFRVQRNGGDNNLNSFTGGNICRSTAGIFNTAEASGTAGHAGYGYARANGTLKWGAEL
jgi:hypothetical protein